MNELEIIMIIIKGLLVVCILTLFRISYSAIMDWCYFSGVLGIWMGMTTIYILIKIRW